MLLARLKIYLLLPKHRGATIFFWGHGLDYWKRAYIFSFHLACRPCMKCFTQKQPSRGVLTKRCSENMQQIYRSTLMPKSNFNKVALQNSELIKTWSKVYFLCLTKNQWWWSNLRWYFLTNICTISSKCVLPVTCIWVKFKLVSHASFIVLLNTGFNPLILAFSASEEIIEEVALINDSFLTFGKKSTLAILKVYQQSLGGFSAIYALLLYIHTCSCVGRFCSLFGIFSISLIELFSDFQTKMNSSIALHHFKDLK